MLFFGEMSRNIGERFWPKQEPVGSWSKPISARTDVTEARSTYYDCEIIFL